MRATLPIDYTTSIDRTACLLQVKVIKGQDSFLKYKSSEPLTRHLCNTCGCQMFGELSGDTPNIVSVLDCIRCTLLTTVVSACLPNSTA